MRVLGVDPGLRATGYGVLARVSGAPRLIEAGVIVPKAAAPLENRLGELFDALVAVIDATRPDIVVLEEVWSAPRSPATAILMGHARGVLCLAAHRFGIPVRTLGHSMVKRIVAGSGAATKDQVNRMIVQRLGLREAPRPADVSDALALALALCGMLEREAQLTRAGLAAGRGA
jgi:crossover junction endodeoxyribonuclease RuvC